jgi:BA14K-like protein
MMVILQTKKARIARPPADGPTVGTLVGAPALAGDVPGSIPDIVPTIDAAGEAFRTLPEWLLIGAAGYYGAYHPASELSHAHVAWCATRYQSYRASDNTFQSLSGPRRPCISP